MSGAPFEHADGASGELQHHEEDLWGESFTGSKTHLQAIGIGVGLPFPGEPGAPKRTLNTMDPRGFPTRVTHHFDGIRYHAWIDFPGRACPPDTQTAYAPGVTKLEFNHCDIFRGSADALVLAGLVQEDQLPGKPGMRKVCVTIFADGTMPTGAPTANSRRSKEPGARSIRKVSAKGFEVQIRLARDIEERRQAACDLARLEWEQRMRAMPRPPSLTEQGPAERPARPRGHLRLVWSASGR